MNEMRDIKCPLCGAPAVVRITNEPHFIGSDNTPTRISYEYDEPSPPPVTTIYGYELEMLRVAAELMHRQGITAEDLRGLVNNIERAYSMVIEITRRDTQRQLDAIYEKLHNPVVPDYLWPKINPYLKEERNENNQN